ncbi:protein Smaug homolog 2 isoform X2 [Rhinoderma darwinii]|uniref:protein Smaug homolog 2 isoform X2 n=1 Tax=Rhinoderma darwinii TaxID=43563 RepID=UPI003F679B16
MKFRDQVSTLSEWFKGWNECEQTVALLSLLKRITRTQARFLQLCLEHSLSDCSEIHILETEANSAALISQWHQESKEKVISLLLSHLPLLQPRNTEAKCEYMKLLQKVLAYTTESNLYIEESRQLLSYALIHPATTLDDRNSLALWLNHLEERLSTGYLRHGTHLRQCSDEWQNPGDSSMGESGHSWHEKPMRENGLMPFPSSSSVPSSIQNVGSSTAHSCQMHPSPLKRSMSLIPTSQQTSNEWLGTEEAAGRPVFLTPDHAPLSPQSSVASSGSEQTEESSSGRNTFHEDGSGMKDTFYGFTSADVPTWLKSLRLHKYASLFSQMSYEEMMRLTEQHLESQNVTKGARHKIALSIQKLRERPSVLRSLEKDILEGGNVRNALQELQQIIITPIKYYRPNQTESISSDQTSQRRSNPDSASKGSNENEPPTGLTADGFQQQSPPTGDLETSVPPLADGDIPGQLTRVLGKVCTQLLVSRPDEENITCYLQLLEKCLTHEAFTETQKKRALSWKQQVLKLLRTFPRKALLEMQGWAFASNSLPIAGSVGPSLARRGQRPFQMPPRAVPPSRIGVMSPGSIGSVSPRHALTSQSTGSQGRQNLWFANPGGSNSMPCQSHSSVQRTHSLPVHTSPQSILKFPPDCQVPVADLEINPRLESLCLSMTEHALEEGTDKTSTI